MQNHQPGLSWKPKSLVVHVERELSFWKSTLSERSKGWLSPETLPHKGKKWPIFPGVVQEWAVKPKLNILVRLQGLPKKPGWTWGFLHLHTRSQAVLFQCIPGGFCHGQGECKLKVTGSSTLPDNSSCHVHGQSVPQWEWSTFSIWAAVPPLPLCKRRAPSSPLTLSRLTWAHTCAF